MTMMHEEYATFLIIIITKFSKVFNKLKIEILLMNFMNYIIRNNECGDKNSTSIGKEVLKVHKKKKNQKSLKNTTTIKNILF